MGARLLGGPAAPARRAGATGESKLSADADGRSWLQRPDVLLGLLVVLGLARLLFPGDVPFIADEPMIVDRALDGLEDGELVAVGLQGTRGVRYGPVPTWIYQAGLVLTSDLRWVALGKIALVTLLTGLAIVLLARRIHWLSPALGAFAFLSPYLWFYSRDLWDNSFGVPFSAMLLATYAGHLETGRLRSLAWAGLFGTLCLLTHLMTVPVVAAVALHFLVHGRRRLVTSPAFAVGVALISAGCLALALPYLVQLPGAAATSFLVSPSTGSLLFALDGFRTFSLVGFDYFIGSWSAGGLGGAARIVSLLSYAVGAYGLYELNRVLRAGPSSSSSGVTTRPSAPGPSAPGPSAGGAATGVRSDGSSTGLQMARVLTLALVLFVLLANGRRLMDHPHYYNGVWMVFFLVWWTGMSHLGRRAWARRAFLTQALVMAAFLAGLATWLHANRGTRSLHYGPTLANQMAVARTLDSLGVEQAPPSAAPHPRVFPQAIGVLRRLNARAGGPVASVQAPPGAYAIVYPRPESTSGEIAVRATDAQEAGQAMEPSGKAVFVTLPAR